MIPLARELERRRRKAKALSRAARGCFLAAQDQQEKAASAFHDRLTSPESLILAFVAGLTVATVSPRSTPSRSEPPDRPDARASTKAALAAAVRLARTYAIKHLLTLVMDSARRGDAEPVAAKTSGQEANTDPGDWPGDASDVASPDAATGRARMP